VIKWHAALCPALAGVNRGSSSRQRSNTNGHRVWNRHPPGGCSGLGTSPGNQRDMPEGCKFHPRCTYVHDRCRRVEPKLARWGEDQRAACFGRQAAP